MFKEYIIKILYISIFGILLELIIPNNKLKKHIISLLSLMAVITMLSPLINILKNDNINKTITDTIDTLSNNLSIEEKNEYKYDFSKYINSVITKTTKEKLEHEMIENIQKSYPDEIKNIQVMLSKEYIIEKIEIDIYRLESVNKSKHISEIIEKISKDYNIPKSIIVIVEGG